MNPSIVPFEVGIEQEFFLSPKHHYWTILNARKEMERKIGICIDQNINDSGVIKINQNCDIVTDGTAMEYRGFFPRRWNNEGFNHIPQTIKEQIKGLKFLEDYRIHDEYSLVESPAYTFNEPNNVFASEKTCYNAYTGESFLQEKKEDDKAVTLRTAGLHIHFSFLGNCVDGIIDQNNRTHSDALVRIFDEIFKIFFYLDNCDKKRIEVYQKYGTYRIRDSKSTQTGKPTLEYRQLSCWHLNANLGGFLTICAMEVHKYLKAKKLLKKQ